VAGFLLEDPGGSQYNVRSLKYISPAGTHVTRGRSPEFLKRTVKAPSTDLPDTENSPPSGRGGVRVPWGDKCPQAADAGYRRGDAQPTHSSYSSSHFPFSSPAEL
jgi:hypothetical protein